MASHEELQSALSELGFEQDNNPLVWNWRFAQSKPIETYSDDGTVFGTTSHIPVQLDAWELAVDDGQIIDNKISITLQMKQVVQRLQMYAKGFFNAQVETFVSEIEVGKYWVLFEFNNEAEETSLQDDTTIMANSFSGVSGFKLQMKTGMDEVRFLMTDFFSLGSVPEEFGAAPVKLLVQAIGYSGSIIDTMEIEKSIFEVSLSLETIAISYFRQQNLDEEAIDTLTQIFRSSEMDSKSYDFDVTDQDITISNLSDDYAKSFSQGSRVPMEILESLESQSKILEVDRTILAMDFIRARDLCEEMIEAEGETIYVLRRLALLGVTGVNHKYQKTIEESIAFQRKNKLFLCSAIRLALQEERNKEALEFLSSLGEIFYREGIDFEGTSSFDVVFPEILGDAWRDEDTSKAIECYSRIIAKRGDIPRIIQKIVAIHREEGNKEEEVKFLDKLSAIETKKDVLARIFLREAELFGEIEGASEKGIRKAIDAIEADRTLYQAAELAARLLCEDGRSEEAIHLLRELLKGGRVSYSDKARASLELNVGRIWQEEYKRIDLAVICYENALELRKDWDAPLRYLEGIFRSQGKIKKLSHILEDRLVALKDSEDTEAKWGVFEELMAIYDEGDFPEDRVSKAVEAMLNNFEMTADSLQRLIAWEGSSIDWSQHIVHLEKNIDSMDDPIERAKFVLMLASFFEKSKPEKHRSMLIEASREISLPRQELLSLVDGLEADGAHHQVAEVLLSQLEKDDQENEDFVLNRLLSLEEGLEDHDFFRFALRAYEKDPGLEDQIKDRLTQMISYGRWEVALQVLDELRKLELSDLARKSWLEFFVNSMQSTEASQNGELLGDLYRELIDASPDEEAILREAVSALKGYETTHAQEFTVMLLEMGRVPNLAQDEVIEMLSGRPSDMAKFYLLKSEDFSETPTQAAAWARGALKLLEDNQSKTGEKLDVLLRLAKITLLSKEEKTDLRFCVEDLDRWEDYAVALKGQIELAGNLREAYNLKIELANVYWHHTEQLEFAKVVYLSLLDDKPNDIETLKKFSELAGEMGENGLQKACLLKCLENEGVVSSKEKSADVINQLVEMEDNRSLIERNLAKAYSKLLRKRKDSLAEKLHDQMEKQLLDSLSSWKALAVHQFRYGDADEALVTWLKAVSRSKNLADFLPAVNEFRSSVEDDELYEDCLVGVIREGSDNGVSEEVQDEASILLAKHLLSSSERMGDALRVLARYHNKKKDDSRIWIVIYALLIDHGSEEDRHLYLDRIVPLLQESEYVVERYNIDLKTLQDDLSYLADKISSGGSTFTPEADLSNISLSLVIDSTVQDIDAGHVREMKKSAAFSTLDNSSFTGVSLSEAQTAIGTAPMASAEFEDDATQINPAEDKNNPDNYDLDDLIVRGLDAEEWSFLRTVHLEGESSRTPAPSKLSPPLPVPGQVEANTLSLGDLDIGTPTSTDMKIPLPAPGEIIPPGDEQRIEIADLGLDLVGIGASPESAHSDSPDDQTEKFSLGDLNFSEDDPTEVLTPEKPESDSLDIQLTPPSAPPPVPIEDKSFMRENPGGPERREENTKPDDPLSKLKQGA